MSTSTTTSTSTTPSNESASTSAATPAAAAAAADKVRETVRAHYGKVAEAGSAVGAASAAPAVGCCEAPEGNDAKHAEAATASGCCEAPAGTVGCCGAPAPADATGTEEAAAAGCGSCGAAGPDASLAIGYGAAELAEVPEGANLGLGCGNPQAIAALRPGEAVLDLGSGGGLDCFLAARQVGPEGRVIGVDMTPAMVSRARAAAARAGLDHVSFRLGEIEHLPVPDRTVDVILSNCVINLAPDKPQVWREAFRVLRPGGRVAISDVVLLRPLPEHLREQAIALSACVAGAATVEETEAALRAAGFEDVAVRVRPESRAFIASWLPGSGAEHYVASATIEARRPASEEAR